MIQKIQWLQARWLFREEAEFDGALDIFTELNATPTEAIALCPKHISGDLAEGDDENDDIKCLSGDSGEINSHIDDKSKDGTKISEERPPSQTTTSAKGLKKRHVMWRDALLSMMRYLTEHRRKIQKAFADNEAEISYMVRITQGDDENLPDVPPIPENSDRQNRETNFAPLLQFQLLSVYISVVAMAQLIDTTLLKLYIECSPSLIGPLLRVKNYCDIEESEKLLLEHKVMTTIFINIEF